MSSNNSNPFEVEVLSFRLPPHNRSKFNLAMVEAKLNFTTHVGNNYSILIRDIGIVFDAMPGEYSLSFPKHKYADAMPEPTILVSWAVRTALADAIIPAFKKWQSEQAQKAAQDSQQQIGGSHV